MKIVRRCGRCKAGEAFGAWSQGVLQSHYVRCTCQQARRFGETVHVNGGRDCGEFVDREGVTVSDDRVLIVVNVKAEQAARVPLGMIRELAGILPAFEFEWQPHPASRPDDPRFDLVCFDEGMRERRPFLHGMLAGWAWRRSARRTR